MTLSASHQRAAPRDAAQRSVRLYRMVMSKHVCPYGIKSKWLLEREGFQVEDRHLTTSQEVEAFQRAHEVETTPQIFVDGERIGGYEDLRGYLGKSTPSDSDVRYQPILAVLSVALAASLALSWGVYGGITAVRVVEWFLMFMMVMLAMLKLQDLHGFTNTFLNYDLLAQRWVPYGFAYPFLEAGAALLMMAGVLPWLSAPVALLIGSMGATSVIQAVWIEKRSLSCACVGGGSKVPLGPISLFENLAMIAMGVGTLVKTLAAG